MRLLMIEDDVALTRAVLTVLEKADYQAKACFSGDVGLQEALAGAYDIILLDRMLPGLDGVRIARALRAGGVNAPILMLTALAGLGDRVDGLDAGADDYLVKPFAMDELLARLRALSRRPAAWTRETRIAFGDLSLDPDSRTLTGPAGACPLSARECDLLACLMRAKGQTAARQALFNGVWGAQAEVEDGNLDSYVHFVRRRLTAVGSRARLKTAYGTGYRLEE
ncbi:MAG: response regulator transcription factor [Clostridia bacterium]